MTECVIRASFSKAKLPLSSQREARDVSFICSSKKFQLLVFCADFIDLMIAVLGPFSHPILKSLKNSVFAAFYYNSSFVEPLPADV